MDVDSCCHCNVASKEWREKEVETNQLPRVIFGVETKIPWSKFHSWLEEPWGKWKLHSRMNTSCTERTHWIFLIVVVSVMSELLAAPPRAIATLAAPWHDVWAASTWMCLTCLTYALNAFMAMACKKLAAWNPGAFPTCFPMAMSFLHFDCHWKPSAHCPSWSLKFVLAKHMILSLRQKISRAEAFGLYFFWTLHQMTLWEPPWHFDACFVSRSECRGLKSEDVTCSRFSDFLLPVVWLLLNSTWPMSDCV